MFQQHYTPFKIKTTPETISIKDTIELTITIPFPVKRDLNLLSKEIFKRSVINY